MWSMLPTCLAIVVARLTSCARARRRRRPIRGPEAFGAAAMLLMLLAAGTII